MVQVHSHLEPYIPCALAMAVGAGRREVTLDYLFVSVELLLHGFIFVLEKITHFDLFHSYSHHFVWCQGRSSVRTPAYLTTWPLAPTFLFNNQNLTSVVFFLTDIDYKVTSVVFLSTFLWFIFSSNCDPHYSINYIQYYILNYILFCFMFQMLF